MVHDITLIPRNEILSMLQNEYMCDTVNPPAQADGFGDYIIIPEVFSVRIKFVNSQHQKSLL